MEYQIAKEKVLRRKLRDMCCSERERVRESERAERERERERERGRTRERDSVGEKASTTGYPCTKTICLVFEVHVNDRFTLERDGVSNRKGEGAAWEFEGHDTERDRDRDREDGLETKTDRDRETERQTETDRVREREGETERERERERERARGRRRALLAAHVPKPCVLCVGFR